MGINEADIRWMQHALTLAEKAKSQNEVPIGAVVILQDEMIGKGWNQPISNNDPTSHAEIIALREAGNNLNNYRLLNSTMYVTLEPCMMCSSAMVHARINRLVFGASDPKTGSVISVFDNFDQEYHNHKVKHEGGICADQCGDIISSFFKERRN